MGKMQAWPVWTSRARVATAHVYSPSISLSSQHPLAVYLNSYINMKEACLRCLQLLLESHSVQRELGSSKGDLHADTQRPQSCQACYVVQVQ